MSTMSTRDSAGETLGHLNDIVFDINPGPVEEPSVTSLLSIQKHPTHTPSLIKQSTPASLLGLRVSVLTSISVWTRRWFKVWHTNMWTISAGPIGELCRQLPRRGPQLHHRRRSGGRGHHCHCRPGLPWSRPGPGSSRCGGGWRSRCCHGDVLSVSSQQALPGERDIYRVTAIWFIFTEAGSLCPSAGHQREETLSIVISLSWRLFLIWIQWPGWLSPSNDDDLVLTAVWNSAEIEEILMLSQQ